MTIRARVPSLILPVSRLPFIFIPPLRSVSSLSEDRSLQTCDLLSSHSLPLISISFKIVASRSWAYEITSVLKTYLGKFVPPISSSLARVRTPSGREHVYLLLSNSRLSLLRFSPFSARGH